MLVEFIEIGKSFPLMGLFIQLFFWMDEHLTMLN